MTSFVGAQGFEPWTLPTKSGCAAGLRYIPKMYLVQTSEFKLMGYFAAQSRPKDTPCF